MVAKVLVLRAPGTNCDEETVRAVREAGAVAFVVHTNVLITGGTDLFDFHGLIIPGGFSYGDRVRAGAIWAAKLRSKIGDELVEYALDGRPVLGICNGFQVLIELGLLPTTGASGPKVALAPNASSRFEARWVYLVCEDSSRCVFTRYMVGRGPIRMPVAHSEGRLIVDPKHANLSSHVVFRYAKPDGKLACGEYPFNPNGSQYDIAGICNEQGNVLGIMPHPERATYSWQLPEFTSGIIPSKCYADGWLIFKSMVDYILERIV